MSLQGQICLIRAMTDHSVWQGDLALRGAWVDLLLRANTEPAELMQRGESVALNRGQLAWSVKGLADKWQVCEEKATKYLAYLQKLGCIRVQASRRRTLITICNYDIYQTAPLADSVPDSVPDSLTSSLPDSVHCRQPSSVTASVTASAQSREKREERHTPRAGETPDWAEVAAFAAGAAVDAEFARSWFERKVNDLTHGFESLRDWRFDLLTWWRRNGAGKKPGENATVNGAPRAKSLASEIMDAENTRKRLLAQMAEHPCNEDSAAYDPASEEYPAWQALDAALRAAEGVLRSIPKDAPEDWQRRLRTEAYKRALSEHPGNPDSRAYDESSCTEQTRREFITLRRELV